MLAATVIVSILLFSFCDGSYDGCDIFDNRFTVRNGVFQDVCGSTTITQSSNGNTISSNDKIVEPVGMSYYFNPLQYLDSNKWAIVFEGRRTVSTTSGFDIILGPRSNSKNCQIRYSGSNNLCIYSYYQSPSYAQCITLPDDVDTLHTIILFYESNQLTVYQNNKFVQTVSKSLAIALGQIAGWFSTTAYQGDIAVKNIMFIEGKFTTTSITLNDIRDYVYTCVALGGVSTSNALVASEMSDSKSLDMENENGLFSKSIILSFVAGMGFMLILNILCCVGYGFCKKKKENNKCNGSQILQQIEMVDDEMVNDEITDDESEQITNLNATNEI